MYLFILICVCCATVPIGETKLILFDFWYKYLKKNISVVWLDLEYLNFFMNNENYASSHVNFVASLCPIKVKINYFQNCKYNDLY